MHSVRVKNRDIPKLARVLWAIQDVKATERKRMWMQDRLWNITQKITGMPGSGGGPKGLEANFAEISEMEEKYDAECARFVREVQEAEAILLGIESPAMRTFCQLRYVMDMSRTDIMKELNLSRWKYNEICSRIEQAQDMAHVEWSDHYILCD